MQQTKTKQNFKILHYVDKILKRPARVIGDIKTSKHDKYYLDDDNIKKGEIDYNPGINKIIREIIDNSLDEYIRTDGEYANKIEINIEDDGTIQVKDNGRGIPIEDTIDPDGNSVSIPEAAWTRVDAGSNFDDEDDNTTLGQNGEGAALTNIFSVYFKGETTNV
jgi:DNA gyrase/topoisomerase IV subunit B